MGKRPKPARGEAWGILNPWGDFWTYETFATELEAREYVRRFWNSPGFLAEPRDLSAYRIVRAKVTVSLADRPKEGGTDE